MKRDRGFTLPRPTLWHALLAGLFILPAALPLFHPTLTHSADGLLHLYRVMALAQAITQGHVWVRWLPDLAFGYGFPLFVFYAPLAYYLTALLSLLPGVTTVAAFNASVGLAMLLAAVGAYLLASELFGPRAGVLSAVAYGYAPFQLHNALFRGGLPAVWAMAAFPLAFWLFTRLINRPSRRGLAASAFVLGAALLMHNTLSLLFGPLLALYLLLMLLAQFWRNRSWRPAAFTLAALLLGAGLAAFFLLPATLEKEFAQVQRVITSPDFDFRFNFVSLGQLLALPQPANTGLLNPTTPLTLGPMQLILAAAGVVAGLTALRRQTLPAPTVIATLTFALAALGASIFMMLPVSQPVWERLPLLAFVQFPHRLLGPAALAVALLAGLAVAALPPRAGLLLTAAGVTLIFLASAPLLYPRYRTDQPARPTPLDMFAYEHRTGAIGTTSFGEYLPIWVTQNPPDSPLEEQYQRGGPIDRLARDYLPAGAAITSAQFGFNTAKIELTAAQPWQAIFNTFYFPGWQATIDGQPAAVQPVTERGLLAVAIPAGQHRLRLEFTETPLRQTANLISIISLLLIGALAITGPKPRPAAAPAAGFTPPHRLALAGLALLLIAAKLIYLDNFSSPLKIQFDDQGQTGLPAQVSRRVNFGDQIWLLGYSLAPTTAPAGQNFKLTAYWQAQQPLTADYSALAQLVDADGHLYAGQDNLHPGALPTGQWQPWGFVQDDHTIAAPPGLPPGDYFIAVGLYHPRTWARLPVLAGGDPGWSDALARPVAITAPEQPPAVAQLGISWPVTAEFAGQLRLLGATPERPALVANDFLRVAVFWEALTAPTQNYQMTLQLVNAAGAPVLETTGQPSYNRYPATRWAAAERVRDDRALWLPANLPPGDYTLQLTALSAAGQPLGRPVTLGRLTLAQ